MTIHQFAFGYEHPEDHPQVATLRVSEVALVLPVVTAPPGTEGWCRGEVVLVGGVRIVGTATHDEWRRLVEAVMGPALTPP